MNLTKNFLAPNFCCKLWEFLLFLYIFSVLQFCVLDTPLLMSPILRDVWFRTQRAALASRRAINIATHPPTSLLTRNDTNMRTEAIFCCVQVIAWGAGTRTAGTCTPGTPPALSSGTFLHHTRFPCAKIEQENQCLRQRLLVGGKSPFFSRMTAQILPVSCCAESVTLHT